MSKSYNSELQMLREFFLFYAPKLVCRFCHKPLYPPALLEGVTFGHRRHTKIHDQNFAVHHEDENRENNVMGNLLGCHSTCHKRHHREKRKAQEVINEATNSGNL